MASPLRIILPIWKMWIVETNGRFHNAGQLHEPEETDVWHKKRAESAFKTARFQRALHIRHRFLTDDEFHATAHFYNRNVNGNLT